MGCVIIKTPEVEEEFRRNVLKAIPEETIDRLGKLIQKVYVDKG